MAGKAQERNRRFALRGRRYFMRILFVYPFIQKYFVKGVLIGSVKG